MLCPHKHGKLLYLQVLGYYEAKTMTLRQNTVLQQFTFLLAQGTRSWSLRHEFGKKPWISAYAYIVQAKEWATSMTTGNLSLFHNNWANSGWSRVDYYNVVCMYRTIRLGSCNTLVYSVLVSTCTDVIQSWKSGKTT